MGNLFFVAHNQRRYLKKERRCTRMRRTISDPMKSSITVVILHRIITLDNPYPANIARSIGKDVADIVNYLRAIEEKDWVEKEGKEGERKRNLILQPQKIWVESQYYDHLQESFPEGQFPPGFEQLLTDLLVSRIENAIETINLEAEDPENPRQRHDFLPEWTGPEQDLNMILSGIYEDVMALSVIADKLGEEKINEPDELTAHTINQLMDYFDISDTKG